MMGWLTWLCHRRDAVVKKHGPLDTCVSGKRAPKVFSAFNRVHGPSERAGLMLGNKKNVLHNDFESFFLHSPRPAFIVFASVRIIFGSFFSLVPSSSHKVIIIHSNLRCYCCDYIRELLVFVERSIEPR